MDVKLIFDDWRAPADGHSLYGSEVGIELASGDFHSGSTFRAAIQLDEDQEEELKEAILDGFIPIFWVTI